MDDIRRMVEPGEGTRDHETEGRGERLGRGLGRIDILRTMRPHIGPALLLALALVILLSFVWLGGYPIGTDAWGHMVRAEYVAEEIQQSGWRAWFDAAWMPTWYMGDPVRTYYPPLTNILLTPLARWIQDAAILHHLFATLVVLILAGGTYLFVQHVWKPWLASLAGILAVWAPYQLRTLFFEGNYPRALAILALPVIALGTENLLRGHARKAPSILLLGAGWVWAILSHPQQALMFAVGFGVYLVARLFLDPDVSLRAAGYWLLGVVAGGMLSTPWTLPAYSRGELSQVPYLPTEKVDLFTAPLKSVLPAADMTNGAILVGFGMLCLTVLSVAARPEPRRVSYAIAGLLSLWFSFGTSGVAFSLLPLNQQLLPERFLNFTSFAFAICASGLIPFKRRVRLARGFILLGLIFIDVFPGLPLLTGRPFPFDQAHLASFSCGGREEPCRGVLLTYPDPNALEVYFAGESVDLVNGWGLENTPHNKSIRRLLGAPEWSPEYFQKLLSQWGVGAAVTRGPGSEVAEQALEDAGYHLALNLGEYDIWIDLEPPSPVQILPERRMLLVGENLPPLLMAFPFAEEASVTNFYTLDPDVLQRYPMLGLMRFSPSTGDLQNAQARLRTYLESGGVAVVELSGMEERFSESLDFLDTGVIRLSLQEDVPIRWKEALEGLPKVMHVGELNPEGWTGATYRGLDEVLAEIEYQENWYPVLGYKEVGAGRVWFVGMNLLYYAQLGGEKGLVEALQTWMLEGADVSRALVFEPVQVESWEASARGLSFQINTPASIQEALVSYTYSPRWRVQIDGSDLTTGAYENLLKMTLPAGAHEVVINYHPFGTPWPIFGLVVGVAAVSALTAWYFFERKTYVPLELEPEEIETDRQEEYAPCANCGFLLAKVGPPTSITYPFQVVDCPICGLQMNDDGFHAGESLTEMRREQALAAWLERYDYKPEIVHERWGFTPDRFFGEPSTFLIPDTGAPEGEEEDVE